MAKHCLTLTMSNTSRQDEISICYVRTMRSCGYLFRSFVAAEPMVHLLEPWRKDVKNSSQCSSNLPSSTQCSLSKRCEPLPTWLFLVRWHGIRLVVSGSSQEANGMRQLPCSHNQLPNNVHHEENSGSPAEYAPWWFRLRVDLVWDVPQCFCVTQNHGTRLT